MMLYGTLLSSSFIVQLMHPKLNKVEVKILWGIIDEDKLGRFNVGDYDCTTAIKEKSKGHIKTTNTIYKLPKEGEVVQLELTSSIVSLLRQGISPKLLIK